MNNKISELLTDDVVIETNNLYIEGNILRMDDFSLQLGNISMISSGKQMFKLSILEVFIAVVSAILIFNVPSIGVVGVLIMGIHFYFKYTSYSSSKFHLTFYSNHGKSIRIYFNNDDFLTKVRNVVESSFNKQSNLTINMKEEKIVQGDHYDVSNSIFEGDTIHDFSDKSDRSVKIGGGISGQAVIASGKMENNQMFNNGSSTPALNWEEITDALKEVLVSDEVIDKQIKVACMEALEVSRERNEEKFAEVIRKHESTFLLDTFKCFAGGILVEAVKQVLRW